MIFALVMAAIACDAAKTPMVATVEAAKACVTRLAHADRHAFILGSKSSTRRAILEAAGARFETMVPEIDEKAIGDRRADAPTDLVQRIALAKANALVQRLQSEQPPLQPPALGSTVLLTGDQVVTYKGVIREKPQNHEEARAFVESYSHAPCATVQAVCLHEIETGRRVLGVDVAEVHFDPMPAEVVREATAGEEVLWCAGGLMVEHPAVQPYLRRVEGGLDSVMGLSTRLVDGLLGELHSGLCSADILNPGGAHLTVLKQQSWAVVGDVLNEAKPAAQIVARLRESGRDVHLVNPRDTTGKCIASLAQLGGRVSAVNLVINPKLGIKVVEDAWRAGIRYLFVQPGADADDVLARGHELGLVVTTGCVLREGVPPAATGTPGITGSVTGRL